MKAFYHLQQYFHKLKNIDYYSQKIYIVLSKNIQKLNEMEIFKYQQKNQKNNMGELNMSDIKNAEEFKEFMITIINSYLIKKKEFFQKL